MPVLGRPRGLLCFSAIDPPLFVVYVKYSQSGLAPAGPPTVRIGETMIVAELNVSRRALLGAAFAVPLSRHPGLDPESPFLSQRPRGSGIPDQVRNDENWVKAVAGLRRAEAAVNAAAGEPDEDRYGDLLVVFDHALKKLLRTPAPDLQALSLKIDLAVDHEVAELTGAEACMAALKRDTRRLASSAHPERVEGSS
jgi:hypothetical protein